MTSATDNKTCITYRLAYTSGQVTLCAEHDDCDRFGVLGPVSHGRHEDACAECEFLDAESRAEEMVSHTP